MAGGSAVGVGGVARLALVATLVTACASAPGGSASTEAGKGTGSNGGAPGQIAAIEGANLLVRGERGTPNASEDDLAGIARADTAFALDIFRELAGEGDQNLVVGPYSIWTALAMVYAGARGTTAEEFEDVLHLDRPLGETTVLLNALEQALEARNDPDVVELNVANQVFAQPGLPLVEDYLTTLTRDFGAPLAELSFADPEAARSVINDWAADRTNDRITELFPSGSIRPATRLVLTNAISLDAAWTYLFDPASTRVEPFTLANGETVDVPMMRFDLYLPLTADGDVPAVELPYGKGDLSMVVLLPDDLDAFVRDVTPESLEAIFGSIREQGIHLSLPQFSFNRHIDLDETLQAMGIVHAYGDADFSGMTEGGGLFLDTVQHEAFIEVDEEGTEAHAATGAGMALSHGPTITFDRPFAFIIRDRPTGAILFLGIVANPLES